MAVKQRNHGLVLKLVGVGIAYQVVHQVYLWCTLQHEFDGLTLDAECAVDSSGKPLCLEAQLFRSWERVAEVASEESHAAVEFHASADSTTSSPTTTEEGEHVVAVTKSVAVKAAQDARRELEALFDDVLSALNSSDSMESMAGDLKSLQSTLQTRLETLPEVHKKLAEDTVAELDTQLNAMPSHDSFNELYQEVSRTLSERSVVTHWAKDLSDTQEKLEAASQHLRHKEQKAEPVNPWVQSLLDLQKSLELRKQELDRLHQHSNHHSNEIRSWDDFDKAYDDFMKSFNDQSTTISPFAQDLIDTQAKMQKMSDDLAKKHRDHALERDAELKKLSGKAAGQVSRSKLRGVDAMKEFVAHSHEDARKQHEAWEREFAENVNSIARDLCSDDAHRDSPACSAFHGSNTKASGDVKKSAPMTHDEWMANIANEAESYHQELCADPQRKGTGPCLAYQAKLANNTVVLTKDLDRKASDKAVDVKTGLRGSSATPTSLSWRSVKAWKATSDPHAAERILTTLTRAEVRHAHWGGMIPKVGLISVVPSGRRAKFQMKYFMDNFLLQNYEGSKQLILVYHHGDRDAQELAKEYADGTYIKAVASRGDGSFPSSSDYRFGAYSADADIIARWDFDEFHMPHQISTQVRAMVLSQRPASVLIEPGADFGREESLIGEASWMRQHWLPLSETERHILQYSRAHQIVQVDQNGRAK